MAGTMPSVWSVETSTFGMRYLPAFANNDAETLSRKFIEILTVFLRNNVT